MLNQNMSTTPEKISSETSSSISVEYFFPSPVGPIEKDDINQRYLIAKKKSDPTIMFPRPIHSRLDSHFQSEPEKDQRSLNIFSRLFGSIKRISRSIYTSRRNRS